MVMIKTNWRKNYYKQFLYCFKKFKVSVSQHNVLPENLKLPISQKQCMFELGGSKSDSGVAMVVGSPSGFPNTSIVLHNRHINGLHTCNKVWPGSLIGLAFHRYGVISIGIYKIDSSNIDREFIEPYLYLWNLNHLTGLTNSDYSTAIMDHWYKHLESTYTGIRRLARATLEKLMSYKCDIPTYIEPFRVLKSESNKDPNFSKLFYYSDLVVPNNVSSLTPKYAIINANMHNKKEYISYFLFDKDIQAECRRLFNLGNAHIYLYLCHHYETDRFVTQAFIAYQEKEKKMLKFFKTTYIYVHNGIDFGRSYDFESFIKSNYNDTYMCKLLGMKNGSIKDFLRHVDNSKDRCISVPLKYSLCTNRYLS